MRLFFLAMFIVLAGMAVFIATERPYLLERWFPSEETKAQLRAVGKYCSAKSSLEGLIAELPFLEDKNLQKTQLEFEKERMKQCGYPFRQPDNGAQQISFDCNTKLYVQRYNELVNQYKIGEPNHG